MRADVVYVNNGYNNRLIFRMRFNYINFFLLALKDYSSRKQVPLQIKHTPHVKYELTKKRMRVYNIKKFK